VPGSYEFKGSVERPAVPNIISQHNHGACSRTPAARGGRTGGRAAKVHHGCGRFCLLRVNASDQDWQRLGNGANHGQNLTGHDVYFADKVAAGALLVRSLTPDALVQQNAQINVDLGARLDAALGRLSAEDQRALADSLEALPAEPGVTPELHPVQIGDRF
jgi:hypothetical protein